MKQLRSAVSGIAVIAVLLVSGVAAGATSVQPEVLVLLDGLVWDGLTDEPSPRSLVITNGHVVFVGERAKAVEVGGEDARVLDLHGALVLPGMRDQHLHVLDTGIPGIAAGAAAPSYSGYNEATAQAFRNAILGYHTTIFAQGETPESGCTRSAVTDEMKAQLLVDEQELLRQGLTATVEAGLSDLGLLDALLELADEGKLRTRWLPRIGAGCMEQAAELGYVTGFGNEWVRVLGVKLYADGWLGPRSAAMRAPYSDRPFSQGLKFLDVDEATAAVARADELGFNITTHAIGDEGIVTVLDAYEANGVTPADRWQIEHAQVADLAIMDRFADLGVIGSIQTSFATTDQRFAEDALGPERLATSYAWRTMLDRGVRLVGSTDFPVEVLAPLWGVQRMVTRVEFDGFPGPDGFLPGERVDLPTTLGLITSDAAFASLEDDDRGVIAVGRWADLTVLREDLFTLPADCVASATVLMTIVNGVVGFEGEQAYPPGAADCASGAAPADEPVITEVAAGAEAAGDEDAATDEADGGSLASTGGGAVLLALLFGLAGSALLHRRRRS